MKRKLLIISTICSIFMSVSVLGAVGDIAGDIYSTDISTTLNGERIGAVSTGDRTLICAEDMYYYGFNVVWDAEKRVLDVYSVNIAENGAPPEVPDGSGTVGDKIGNYFETDIVTYLDGKAVDSYNLEGRTYIYASQMRELGYEVVWSEQERGVSIWHPKYTGFLFNIPMSYGKKQTEEAEGTFSVRYNEGECFGMGDAEYFNLDYSQGVTDCVFNLSLYQNEGLLYSSAIFDKLNSLVTSGFGVDAPIDPAEKYDLVNETVSIVINGEKAKKVEVSAFAGNGHRDFVFTVKDVKKYKKDEIKNISFKLGNPVGEEFKITVPDYAEYSFKSFKDKLLKNKYDIVQGMYQSENYFLIYVKESKNLGTVVDRLYIADKNTGKISEDILNEVRHTDGFDTARLNPFAFSCDEEETLMYFSCGNDVKRGDFAVDIKTGEVKVLGESFVKRGGNE